MVKEAVILVILAGAEGSPPAVTTATFSSMDACETARKEIASRLVQQSVGAAIDAAEANQPIPGNVTVPTILCLAR